MIVTPRLHVALRFAVADHVHVASEAAAAVNAVLAVLDDYAPTSLPLRHQHFTCPVHGCPQPHGRDDDGDWWSLGHLDAATFIADITPCEYALGGLLRPDPRYLRGPGVEHGWAVLEPDTDGELRIRLADAAEPGATAVTTWSPWQ